MALNGAVYNVTQYMDFHPGGWEELVKGVGRDATDMFNEVHKWVNYQGLLEACLVGKLVDGPAETVMTPPKPPPPSLLPPATGEEDTRPDPRLSLRQRVTNIVTGMCAGKQLAQPVSCCYPFMTHQPPNYVYIKVNHKL